MTPAIKLLAKYSNDMETALFAVSDQFAPKFTMAIRAQLLDWQKRFPRHKFHAWEGHGMLSFDVKPAVRGETAVEYLTGERGAIGELGKEAQTFLDVWVKAEWRMCSPLTTARIEV